ncbi:MAG: hypothetical protein GKR90_08515 [Pseudomonadales bacterium]|nr:hypothetical protein [Pseudomonadales bacterium]
MTKPEFAAYEAVAKLHHAYFLGLQLMVASNEGPEVVGEWMFRLFRRQHEEKFLSSFGKLGLTDLPHAVACAKYHVLSNGVGGVPVEYMYESDRKAWVRFRYPRWMFAGPTVCGMPRSASLGFLSGWYAHNGVSLGNPRLGFVCVSEDMTGEFGLCGYFYEYDDELTPEQRLRFAKDEKPPRFDASEQPIPPIAEWNSERLAKANRNYAVEYVRNGVSQLMNLLARDQVAELTQRSARLIGLQYAQELADDLEVSIASETDLSELMQILFLAMGDSVEPVVTTTQVGTEPVSFDHQNLGITKGMEGAERDVLLRAWSELFAGFGMAQQNLMTVRADIVDTGLRWEISSLYSS